jgi:hypothetical protein
MKVDIIGNEETDLACRDEVDHFAENLPLLRDLGRLGYRECADNIEVAAFGSGDSSFFIFSTSVAFGL